MPENPGKVAIDPGNWRTSEVFHRIISTDPDYQMPTPESHLSLNAQEKAVLLKWIKEGAEYKPHWAFEKPVKAKIPRVKDDEWPRNPIDHFVLHKLEEKGLSHSQEDEKENRSEESREGKKWKR